MMSGHGTVETAVRTTQHGAYDFIEKPLSIDKVLLTIQHALEQSRLDAREPRAARADAARARDHRRVAGDRRSRQSRSTSPRRATAGC